MRTNPFDQISAQILEEERKLRTMAEVQARAYRNALKDILLHLSPETVEEWKRENPTGAWSLEPEEWERIILQAARRRKGWGGDGNDPRVRELEAEKRRLEEAVRSLMEENRALREQLENRLRTPAGKSNEVPEITIPPMPPAAHSRLFRNWKREGYALAVMAATGWSMRLSIAEVLADRDENLSSPRSGSLRRMFEAMERNGLLETHIGQVTQAKVALVTLSDVGREVARAIGVEPVESEWERLMRLHGGEAQSKHAAMVVVFTYQARKRGWRTEVCPEVEGPADPDVLLEKDGERVYVEVEGESGSQERRAKKWRNMADLQGFVALAAVHEAMRQRLVAEAKGASKRGFATDIQYLIQNPSGGLWAETW